MGENIDLENDILTIDKLKEGDRAFIKRLLCSGRIRRRLSELGFHGGAELECVGISPPGDPLAYMIGGAIFAIRRSDGRNIEVIRR